MRNANRNFKLEILTIIIVCFSTYLMLKYQEDTLKPLFAENFKYIIEPLTYFAMLMTIIFYIHSIIFSSWKKFFLNMILIFTVSGIVPLFLFLQRNAIHSEANLAAPFVLVYIYLASLLFFSLIMPIVFYVIDKIKNR